MATKEFQMWGNNVSMRFPKEVIDELGIHLGLKATVDIEEGKIVIVPEHKAKKVPAAKELLAVRFRSCHWEAVYTASKADSLRFWLACWVLLDYSCTLHKFRFLKSFPLLFCMEWSVKKSP